MKTMCIEQAISAGGTMSLYGKAPSIFRATMSRRDDGPIYGEESASAESAIESMHDAANEMQENGSV